MEARSVLLVLVTLVINFHSFEAAICGWDTVWYNTSVPSEANNFTDTEVAPDAKILDTVCDRSAGGRLKVRCQTDDNMPFEFVRNDTSRQYFATCIIVNGLICKPWEGITAASCPDFSIQLGCDCPTTVVPATNPGITSTTKTGVVPGATPVGSLSTAVSQRSGVSTGDIGQSSNGPLSGNGNTVGTGSGVGTGNTFSTGNRNGTGNEVTGGKGNAGGSGNESGNTEGSENGTGSSGTQSGSGSSDGNSKSLNSWDRNGSASKERNVIGVWAFVLLTLYIDSM